MPVSVIVGGQFGSEGKGKVACHMARSMHASWAVRCGGSNSGHTVIADNGEPYIFRHLPTAAILPDVKLALVAGSYIDPAILLNEIEIANITPDRLLIDPKAVIINGWAKDSEVELGKDIGSTGTGTGAALMARIARKPEKIQFASESSQLMPYVGNVNHALRAALSNDERIILEGTQGFGLSWLHSPYYPFVTSRDTTAASFISESGLSPLDVDDIILVIRAFPIRVGGNSGFLPNETTWEVLSKSGNFDPPLIEKTSVTRKTRRVAFFDEDIVLKAIAVNSPTRIVLNHVDYINRSPSEMEIEIFLRSIENRIKRKIDYVGFSPDGIEKRPYSVGFDCH